MKRVFKYPIEVTDVQTVDAPADWEPLSVQMQGETLCLWALIDDDQPTTSHRVFVHGTGHEVHAGADRFVGTFQVGGGALVFHVFTEVK